jgi:hypothetical protein
VTEYAVGYGDESQWSDQAAFEALLMHAVRDQLTRNEHIVIDAQQYLPGSDIQMMQVFEEFGLTRSLDDQDEYVADSQSSDEDSVGYEQFADYGDVEVEQDAEEDVPYEGYDGGPLEFDTMDEAQEYAVRTSREILDEILDELSREHLGASGVVDMAFDEMEQLCMDKVLPGVWKLMDDD